MSKSIHSSGGNRRRAAPARRIAVQQPRHRLQVVHSKHTGRLLPHSATSYPMLGMILLCMGVIMSGWTHIVSGLTLTGSGSYVVTASVPGTPPTVAAVIVSPAADTRFTTKPITVTGTCQYNVNGTYVSIYRNNTYGGSAVCDNLGQFSIPTDLFDGANSLIIRTFNFGATAGPDSAPVTVYYDPPATAGPQTTTTGSTTPNTLTAKPAAGFSSNSSTTSASSAPSTSTTPLVITSDFSIKGYTVDQVTQWQFDLSGGSAPYAIAIDWGDGSHGIISQANPGPIEMTHIYSAPGDYRGIYVVKITATDADGHQSYLQLLVVVNPKDKSLVSGIGSSNFTGTDYSNRTLEALGKYVWPTYGVTLLMLGSFWLGEHHILQHAGKHIIRRPRRI